MKEKFASLVHDVLIDFIEKSSSSKFSEISIHGPELNFVMKKSSMTPVVSNYSTISVKKGEIEKEPLFQKAVLTEDICSKWVGVFYHNQDKNRGTLKTGDSVEEGQLLGKVKCMNLDFDVKSPVNGKVFKVIDNEQPVEYGRVLFKITKEGD